MHVSKLTNYLKGLRYCRMRGKVRKSSFVEILLHIQFFTTIAIILSVVLLEAGLAMVTDSQCHAASVVCILLFGLSKSALYEFPNVQVGGEILTLQIHGLQRTRTRPSSTVRAAATRSCLDHLLALRRSWCRSQYIPRGSCTVSAS